MVSTTLKPQNLVQNRNSKTHLTNHCLGIRCGKKLLKVVEPQGVKYKSTFTYFNILQDTSNRYQSRLNRIDRKDEYIVNDLFYESSTIYQETERVFEFTNVNTD